ncbi:MAG: SRPBCC family protein [Actinoplanes sp.]
MSFDPGPPAEASVVPTGDRWTLIFIRELRQAPEIVWRALTDPAELDQWAPFTAARDLNDTGDTVLTMVDGDAHQDLPATVLRAEPPAVLEYTWGDDRLRWELEPAGAGTRLTLRHTLADAGIEAQVATGWHICLVVMQHLLDGEPMGVIRGQVAKEYGFDELREAYGKKFAG